mmetsp:Transcript_7263/g.21430  ORF Transcript_7263/g.21430 Transcript_7263/m.21430 type:complete len:340 (-) Transcript_7263:72-1091(-)
MYLISLTFLMFHLSRGLRETGVERLQRRGVPRGHPLVELVGVREHAVHGRDLADVPVLERLVERGGAHEHEVHSGDLLHVPLADRLVKGGALLKHLLEAPRVPRVPAAEVRVELVAALKHRSKIRDFFHVPLADVPAVPLLDVAEHVPHRCDAARVPVGDVGDLRVALRRAPGVRPARAQQVGHRRDLRGVPRRHVAVLLQGLGVVVEPELGGLVDGRVVRLEHAARARIRVASAGALHAGAHVLAAVRAARVLVAGLGAGVLGGDLFLADARASFRGLGRDVVALVLHSVSLIRPLLVVLQFLGERRRRGRGQREQEDSAHRSTGSWRGCVWRKARVA